MTARLQIRAKTYRGVDGFTISGTDGLGRTGQRVFARTRAEAERIRDAMKAGEDWTFDKQEETAMSKPLTVTEDSYGWKYEGGEEPQSDLTKIKCACGHPMSAHSAPTGEREPYGECCWLVEGSTEACDCREGWPVEDDEPDADEPILLAPLPAFVPSNWSDYADDERKGN